MATSTVLQPHPLPRGRGGLTGSPLSELMTWRRAQPRATPRSLCPGSRSWPSDLRREAVQAPGFSVWWETEGLGGGWSSSSGRVHGEAQKLMRLLRLMIGPTAPRLSVCLLSVGSLPPAFLSGATLVPWRGLRAGTFGQNLIRACGGGAGSHQPASLETHGTQVHLLRVEPFPCCGAGPGVPSLKDGDEGDSISLCLIRNLNPCPLLPT